MDQNTQQERMEQLERQAREYLMQSKDPIFTQYLQQLLPRIRRRPEYIDQLQAELDKSVEFWHERQRLEAKRAAEMQTMQSVTGESAQASQTQTSGATVEPAQSPVPPVQAQAAPRAKKNTEFVIATVALSVVGGIFILTGLVLLGMNFMNGWVKGLSLYAIALIVLLVSELVVYRKWQKLGQVFSTIGVAALYLVTMINTLSLHNFGVLVAAGITALITAVTVGLSLWRDSLIHRLLGIASCWLFVYPLGQHMNFTEWEVLFVVGLILLLGLLCMYVPSKKHCMAAWIVQMISTAVMLPVTLALAVDVQEVPQWVMLVIYGVFFLLGNLLLVRQSCYAQKERLAGRSVDLGAILAPYIVYLLMAGGTTVALDDYRLWDAVYQYGSIELNGVALGAWILTAAALAVTVLAVVLMRKTPEKWLPCYFFALVSVASVELGEYGIVIYATVLLLAVKVLSRFAGKSLYALDAILTVYYCILLFTNRGEIPEALILLAGTVLGMFLVYGWTTYQEILLTFALAFYAYEELVPMLKLPAFSGILFVSILLFNNLDYMRGKHIRVFNVFVLVGQIGALLGLASPVYRNSYLTYLCMMVFVLAYLVLTLQERYYMEFRHKELIIVLFLTYMALIVKTNLPVINSILIMVIALISVTLGFVRKDKPVRIYGLVLALCTCGKIALYDYWGAPVLQKTILFFVVGAIALAIAGIYIVLEKKWHE